jgi:hypothetical protein
MLAQRKSFVCHSYENCRGVGIILLYPECQRKPFWNAASRDSSFAARMYSRHTSKASLLNNEYAGDTNARPAPSNFAMQCRRSPKSFSVRPLPCLLPPQKARPDLLWPTRFSAKHNCYNALKGCEQPDDSELKIRKQSIVSSLKGDTDLDVWSFVCLMTKSIRSPKQYGCVQGEMAG